MTRPQTTDHRPQTGSWWHAVSLRLAACCLLLVGCVHRSLTIRTDPPGAAVYVNDQSKGMSPVTYDFLWYGWHRVTLRKNGFERLEDRRLLSAPIQFWIPFDLVVELLPVKVRDARTWSYTLTPAVPLPEPVPPAIEDPKTAAPALAPATPAEPQQPARQP